MPIDSNCGLKFEALEFSKIGKYCFLNLGILGVVKEYVDKIIIGPKLNSIDWDILCAFSFDGPVKIYLRIGKAKYICPAIFTHVLRLEYVLNEPVAVAYAGKNFGGGSR